MISNIQHKIRVLDGTKVTYASWVRLFTLHAKAYKVLSHIDGTAPPAPTAENYVDWCEIDAHVLQWIYGTLSDDLLPRVLEDESTAYEAWQRVSAIFLSNKGARAAALESEFNNLKLANLPSLDAYCQKLKDLAGQLKDVDAAVSDKRLVLQLVRGLPSSYDTVASFINQSLPSFETARSMLELELNRQSAQEESSASEALVISNPPSSDSSGWSDKSKQSQQAPRNSNYRGNNYDPNFNSNNYNHRRDNRSNNTGKPRPPSGSPSFGSQNSGSTNSVVSWPPVAGPWPYPWTPPPCPYPTYPGWSQPWQMWGAPRPMRHAGRGSTGQAHVAEAETPQLTDIGQPCTHWGYNNRPKALGTLISPSSASNIRSILVGNGNSILVRASDNNVSVEFDPFGFFVKDLEWDYDHEECDNGELYPVSSESKSSSPVQYSFLTHSSDVWHSRLGHPGSNILQLLRRQSFINCNKESNNNSLCHSCQISKHKRLPFNDSTSATFAPFDIIHADLWTSPVLSKSNYKYYLVLIDNFTQFVWVYPLTAKSEDEFRALKENHTWDLVPRPVDTNVIRCLWLFRHKFHSDGSLQRYKARLVVNGKSQQEFVMTDLGVLNHFLGIMVTRSGTSLFLSQAKYAESILRRASMSSCNPSTTPVDVGSKLDAAAGPLISDPSLYRSLAGALQYLTITRPDIAYAVQQVCLFMHAPKEPHLHFLKRLLRYVKGTLAHGLTLSQSRSLSITAYSDADWSGCPNSRRSTSGYCVFLGDNIVSWSSKRQPTVSRSSAEAEYRGVANAVAETSWLRNLLCELHVPISRATLVFCDNVSAVYLAGNPVQHQRTKHIEIDIHFVREKVQAGLVRVLHVPSAHQYADIFTKGLPRYLFTRFRSSLSVRPPPAPTVGAY
ncbi:uncharacterized protein LOC141590780 [Silene latifolia]|uniref:uncharacterized protein LOC141590780 n=1 Tax=Silene latifolia TaxID=37657 RepID=UPI003D773552